MTARRVMAGIKTYLTGAGLSLTDLSYATVEEAGERTFPFLLIEDTGTQEAEPEALRGVYEVAIDVSLMTNPEDTSTADHDTAMDELYAALGDTPSLTTALDGETNLKCWAVNGVNQNTSPEDGRRRTTVSLTVVAAEI